MKTNPGPQRESAVPEPRASLPGGPTPIASGSRGAHDAEHALVALARSGGGVRREDFLHDCAQSLARACAWRWALIGVCSDAPHETLQVLALWDGERIRTGIEYPLAGTAFAWTLEHGGEALAEGAAARFPDDGVLRELDAAAYVGAALTGADGAPIGLVAVFDSRPRDPEHLPGALVELCAARVARSLERQDAARALAEHEANYRDLHECSIQATLIHRDWRALYVNPACVAMFGYDSVDEMLALDSLDRLFAEDEHERLKRYRDARMRGDDAPLQYELQALRRDGRRITLQNVARRISWKGRPAIQTVLLDVTERKRAEHALHESEQNFRQLAEGSIEAILIQRDFAPLYVNPACAAMLGFQSVHELLQLESIDELFRPDERVRIRGYASARQRGAYAPSAYTARMQHRDGRTIDVRVLASRTRWNGEPAVQGTMVDITEQRRAEHILRTLHEFSAHQELDFEQRIDALLQAGCDQFQLPVGMLSRIRGNEFRIVRAVSPDASIMPGTVYDLRDTYCIETIRHDRPVLFSDAHTAGIDQHRCFDAFHLRAYAGVALRVRGELYGALSFSARSPRQARFGGSDERSLELMGRWVAGELARRVAEQDRIESERRFRDFAECSADWFWETDHEHRFTQVFGRYEEITGLSTDQALGRTQAQLYREHVGDPAPLAAKNAALAEQRAFANFEINWTRPDGRSRVLTSSGRPVFAADGRFAGFRGVGRDVTEQVSAARALRDSEERFRDFASLAADWFWETDADLRFTYVSEQHSEVTGRPPGEFLGRTRSEAYAGTVQLDADWQRHLRALQAREPYSCELEVARPDGSPLIVFNRGKPVFDSNGTFRGYRGIGRDVTDVTLAERELQQYRSSLEQRVVERTRELEATQKELLQQERLATIGRLVGTVSHELRNPLGAVRNAAFFLQRKVPPEQERWREYLEIIDKEVNAADQIIADLLETTRAKLPVLRNVNLRRVVKQVFQTCNPGPGVELRYQAGPRELYLTADPGHLRQVLLNLVTNSVQAVGERGNVLVSARGEDHRTVIEISDTGPGIPREHHEQVFEPLFTTKSKGNGLGLWICQEIVQRHGGSLELVDTGGAGATFVVGLPRRPVEPMSTTLE